MKPVSFSKKDLAPWIKFVQQRRQCVPSFVNIYCEDLIIVRFLVSPLQPSDMSLEPSRPHKISCYYCKLPPTPLELPGLWLVFFFFPKAKFLLPNNVFVSSLKNKNQDATYYFIVLLIGSTCFGHYYDHHQELATTLVVSFLVSCSPDTTPA